MNRRQGSTRGPLPTVAVITMTRDEAAMLPRWITYYGAQVGYDNVLVLDDNSTDGSTRDLPCPVIHLPPSPWKAEFEATRMRLVSGLARALLACYDVVVFCDVDEFIVPDPARYHGLLDFLAQRTDRDVVAPVGLNLIHKSDIEPPLDPRMPILEQRHFVKFVPVMCKPSIKRVPAPWAAASHGIAVPFEVDPEVFMIHLKFYDEDALRTVGDHRLRMHEMDGRAAQTTWTVSGSSLVDQLRGWVSSPGSEVVPELDARTLPLADVVQRTKPQVYRATGGAQLALMANQPLLRLPSRFSAVF